MGTPSSAGAATPTSTTSAATDNTVGTNGNKSPKKDEQSQQNNSVWSEHVNAEGKKYYYNRLTKKSVWDKPEELKSKEELVLKEREAECPWKEYTTADNKKYYHNGKTNKSVWEIPEEYKQHLERLKKYQEEEERKKDDPREQFKLLLADKGMLPSWTWEQAMNATKNDSRWKLLKMSEKKQVFQEYANDLRRDEREQKRRKEEQIKEDFVQLCFDKNISMKSTFKEAAPLLQDDSRYKAVVSDREKEEFFEHYLVERDRRQREEARAIRRDAMNKLHRFLESNSNVTVNTPWRKFKDELNGPEYEVLEKIDKLQVFSDYIRELEHKEDKEYNEAKYKQMTASRKAREVFRALLMDHYLSGDITVKTRWKEYSKKVRNDQRYLDLIPAFGSTPAELFYDFIEDLEEKYQKDKKKIKELMEESSINIDSHTNFDEWRTKVNKTSHDNEKFQSITIDPSHLRILFDEFVDKLNYKKKRKSAKHFKSLLKSDKDVRRDTSWSDVRHRYESIPDLDERDKEDIFNKFSRDYLQRDREREDKHKHKKKRTRSKSRSRSASRSPSRSREEDSKGDRDRKTSEKRKRDESDYHGDRSPKRQRMEKPEPMIDREEGEIE